MLSSVLFLSHDVEVWVSLPPVARELRAVGPQLLDVNLDPLTHLPARLLAIRSCVEGSSAETF